MNYYQHHIGDYVRATAHLTWMEDCAYRRMIEWYYAEEKPLPSDKRQLYRVIRAVSKQERDAVDAVLSEFFHPSDDGFRHRRCDAEIERAQSKSTKAKQSAALRWQSEGNANASPNAMRSHSVGNALHKPITNSQKEEPPNPPPDKPAARRSRPRSSIGVTELPDEWRLYAASELPGWDLDGLFRSFRDHHLAKATMAADWPATWRTWVGNAPEYSRRFAPGGIVQGGQVRLAGGFVA